MIKLIKADSRPSIRVPNNSGCQTFSKLFCNQYKLKEKLSKNLNAKVLGPVIAPINKINKNFRYRILIRSRKTQKTQKILSNILNNFKNQKEIKLAVDVDPISFN